MFIFFFLMIRRPPRSTLSSSSAASDVYKRQVCYGGEGNVSYANAYTLGPLQDAILEQLLARAGGSALTEEQLVSRLELGYAQELIEAQLTPVHQRLNMDLSTVTHLLTAPKARL
eukprot:TRINITY_DN4041_c0_g2_i8.p1 TRINITY_DN4041_c0_g2~~TRINITY_DN4041_c0_g2_i8.p1  ORF type:complete len:115 (+),score=44.18 TRINITY_DN4041_c0_g2_i8:70-414(+)